MIMAERVDLIYMPHNYLMPIDFCLEIAMINS